MLCIAIVGNKISKVGQFFFYLFIFIKENFNPTLPFFTQAPTFSTLHNVPNVHVENFLAHDIFLVSLHFQNITILNIKMPISWK